MVDQGAVERASIKIEPRGLVREPDFISEIPISSLTKRIEKETAGDALDCILSQYDERTRLIGIGETHHEWGAVGRAFAAMAIKELIAADKINTVFVELRGEKQEVINSYIDGDLSDLELINSYVAGLKPKDKATNPGLAIENYLETLQAVREAKETIKDAHPLVRCVDVSPEERMHFPRRDVPMRLEIIDYLQSHPEARGLYYAGGEHVSRNEGRAYEEINKFLSQFGYRAFRQVEMSHKNLVKATRAAGINRSIMLPTKGTVLAGKKENWAYRHDLPIERRFDGVIIHP